MFQITIDVVNARQVIMNMAGFASDVSDLTTIWPYVAPVLETQTMEKFATEGEAGKHGTWEPLAPNYAAWKEKHYPGKPILQREGKMIESFREGDSNHVDRRTSTMLEWGSAVPYAVYHQWGYRTRLGGGYGAFGSEFVASAFGASGERERGMKESERQAGLRAFVPARRARDPSDEDINGLRRAFQRGIVNLVRRRGFAIAREAYGPGEMEEITGGEAFRLGKTGGA